MIWLMIGYMFLFIHRPFEVWPTLGNFRIELIYMLITGSIWLTVCRKHWIPNRLHFAYLTFAFAVLAAWAVSPWLSVGAQLVSDYFKIFVFYLLIVTAVSDERQLKRLTFCFLGIMAVYMLHSLNEYHNGRHNFRMGITRLIGVDESNGDPNAFGATVVYALPVVVPFWLSRPSVWVRGFLAMYLLLSMVCIGLTGSRSAFVGLILAGALVALHSRYRVRLLVLFLAAAPVLWFCLPASLQNRFETIIYPEVGPANAQTSAEARLTGLRLGVTLWSGNPVTGCGPGAWRPATGSRLESHNMYGELIGELGSLGVAAFLFVLICYWLNARAVANIYKAHPAWERDFPYYLAQALGISLVLLLFEGNFGHNLFRYTWLWYGGFLIVTRHCVEQRLAATIGAHFNRPWHEVPARAGRPYEWIASPA